jgi:hypothetical protein
MQVEGQEKLNLKVVYSGIDPLPDTFKDRIVRGSVSPDHIH